MSKNTYKILLVGAGIVVGIVIGVFFQRENTLTPLVVNDSDSKVVSEELVEEESLVNSVEKDGIYFGFIKSFKQEGGMSVVVDFATYADCTKGQYAKKDCPNGTFISNVNSKLRTFKLTPGVEIIMQTFSFNETGNFNTNQRITVQELINSKKEGIYNLPYWFTVQDGKISQIKEQFVP